MRRVANPLTEDEFGSLRCQIETSKSMRRIRGFAVVPEIGTTAPEMSTGSGYDAAPATLFSKPNCRDMSRQLGRSHFVEIVPPRDERISQIVI